VPGDVTAEVIEVKSLQELDRLAARKSPANRVLQSSDGSHDVNPGPATAARAINAIRPGVAATCLVPSGR